MAARQKGVVVPITATDNTERAFDDLKQQIEELRSRISQLRSQLAMTRSASDSLSEGMAHTGAQMAYASGAIREFEGQLPVRAVERFLSQTLGMGPALAAAFPVVGAIAFGGIIVRDIERLMEMRSEAAKLATSIQQAFSVAIAKEREHADQIAVSNDRLEAEIAKLEHRPAGGLQAGLDQAALSADKLGDALHSAVEEATALFDKKYQVGILSQLNGTKGTDDIKTQVLGAMSQVDALKDEYAGVIQGARDSGNSKEHLDELNQMMLAHIQDVYAKLDARLRAELKQALNDQADDRNLGGDGSHFQARINAIQGSLSLSQAQQRAIGGEYLQSNLAPRAVVDKSDHSNDEQGRKAQEAADKLKEALDGQKAAEDRASAARQKAADDAEIAELEEKHRKMQTSDEDYFRQKDTLQQKSIAAELAADEKTRAGKTAELSQYAVKKADPIEEDQRQTKIAEIKAKIAEIDARDAALTAQQAKSTRERVDAETELAKKRTVDSDAAGARLEQRLGNGSTSARLKQSDDEFARSYQALVGEGADPDSLSAASQMHGMDLAQIGIQGANEAYGQKSDGIQLQRKNVDDQQARGIISDQSAQQQRIALDKEEAAALQQLLPAYQAAAAAGDVAAGEKVAQLQQQIAELQNPVNQTAAAIRSQLNSALEELFENIGKGTKAWSSFRKAIQADVLKDTYKQFLQPAVQTGMGAIQQALSGHRTGGSPTAASGLPSAASALAGFALPKIGLPGLGPKAGAVAQPVQIQLINQTGTPMAMSGAGQQGDMIETLRSPVEQIVLENMGMGGSIAQALSGIQF